MKKHLETDRLILRPFEDRDYPLILKISSDPETVKYLYHWGHPGATPASDAHRFLSYAMDAWQQSPIRAREYCIVLKETGEALGDGSVEYWGQDGKTAEIGWILTPEHRGKGYVTEMGKELLHFAFEEMGVEKVIAHCDERNMPSQRVMLRLGMEKSELAFGVRPAKEKDGVPGDELTYAITKDQYLHMLKAWEMQTLPCVFNGFMDLPDLTDGEIRLICHAKAPADPAKKYVPAYHFHIALGSEVIGKIDLRIGYTPGLYVGGNIGYSVDEKYRGHGYAGRACRLLLPVMRYHRMPLALITNDVRNAPSRRVCEKLGLRHLGQMKVPYHNDMYARGIYRVNIYALEDR